MLLDGVGILFENPHLPHLLSFLFVPLKLLFAELLAIGIGRVHDLSPLGGLHGGRSSTKKGGLGHEKRGEEAHRSVREIVIEAQ